MTYFKFVADGYIVSLSTGRGAIQITRQEYDMLLEIIRDKPDDPEGYRYMLRDADLQWELVELPPEPEPDPDEDAGEEDYIQVLDDLGVRLS